MQAYTDKPRPDKPRSRKPSASLDAKIAKAAARRLGFSAKQRAAYEAAVNNAPAVYPDGRPVPIHDIGMTAARNAGYTGPAHPGAM